MTSMTGAPKATKPLPKVAKNRSLTQLYVPPAKFKSRFKAEAKNRKISGYTGDRPWGGDKIAFEPLKVAPENQEWLDKANAVIEAARARKREQKADIEKRKEDSIKELRRIAAMLGKAKLRPIDADLVPETKAAYDAQIKVLDKILKGSLNIKGDKARAMALHLALCTNDSIIRMSKDILHHFHDELGKSGWDFEELRKELRKEGLFVTKIGGSRHEIVASSMGRDIPVMRVHWGVNRVVAKEGEDGVFQQHGYTDAPEDKSRRKEYVEDDNGVLTRRYATRAINYWHLAAMMGWTLDKNDKAKYVGTSGQAPRGSRDTFGTHTKTFDVNSGAVVDETNWDSRYQGKDAEKMETTGMDAVKVRSRANHLDASSPMNINEGASMQVRNGSGPGQPMLSLATTQEPLEGQDPKVIRGNKGERFDQTAESMAVLEIDLAKAKQRGIKFVNQHSNDSNEYKIAYDRYNSATDKGIKRHAKEELDEYIYSGRKNREVTIDRIPNWLITKIKLTGGAAKWPGIDLPRDEWIPWTKKVDYELSTWLTPARLERTHRRAKAAEEEDDFEAGTRK